MDTVTETKVHTHTLWLVCWLSLRSADAADSAFIVCLQFVSILLEKRIKVFLFLLFHSSPFSFPPLIFIVVKKYLVFFLLFLPFLMSSSQLRHCLGSVLTAVAVAVLVF